VLDIKNGIGETLDKVVAGMSFYRRSVNYKVRAMARDDVRAHLGEVGLQTFLAGGYNHTGVKDVVAAADVPKGSFYYYFGSKEDFACAVIDRYADGTVASAILDDRTRPPLERLRRYFEVLVPLYEGRGLAEGCLLGNLSLEMADQSAAMRARLAAGFARWQATLAAVFREAAARDELPPGADPDALAAFCLDGWEGALLRMKAEKSAAPLRLFIAMVFDHLVRR